MLSISFIILQACNEFLHFIISIGHLLCIHCFHWRKYKIDCYAFHFNSDRCSSVYVDHVIATYIYQLGK